LPSERMAPRRIVRPAVRNRHAVFHNEVTRV
jgi:hypothetical protein